MKGCPLKCLWCHNPESQRPDSEIMFYRDKCTGCGRCDGLRADDADFVCYAGAKKVCGRETAAENVINEVLKDGVFYKNSGGGMTLSGGEPLMQFEFARELLGMAKARGIHTAVETCGFVEPEKLRKIAEDTDIFLFDCKETDALLHKQFTGVDNRLILENLFMLDGMGKDIILRCPIIPGYNDREDHLEGIAQMANRLKNILRVEIEPYHDLGEHKYAAVGRNAVTIATIPGARIAEMVEAIRKKTDIPICRA